MKKNNVLALTGNNGRLTDKFIFNDNEGSRGEQVYLVPIKVKSPEIIFGARVFLEKIFRFQDGHMQSCEHTDQTPLKWALIGYDSAYIGAYKRDLIPGSVVDFDALAVRSDRSGLFLHSQRDYFPRDPIITEPGRYSLDYVVYAPNIVPYRLTLFISLGINCDIQSPQLSIDYPAKLSSS